MSGEAVAAFAECLINTSGEYSCECELDISKNPLGYDGLLAIFKMLRYCNCPVTKLSLHNTDLTKPLNTESHYLNIQLKNMGKILNLGSVFKSSRLTYLDLSNNNFNEGKVYILAECVRVCTSLHNLLCCKCSLTSGEVIRFLDHLKSSGTSHKNLRWWFLMGNSIDDEGVTAIIEYLPDVFPSLEDVDLDFNPVSDEVKGRLQGLLEVSFICS